MTVANVISAKDSFPNYADGTELTFHLDNISIANVGCRHTDVKKMDIQGIEPWALRRSRDAKRTLYQLS